MRPQNDTAVLDVTALLYRYRQAELVHARWAMLGVAGVLGQEIFNPNVFWYEAGLPENLPGPFKNINMGGLLAWEFLLMHWVEVRRWQDYRNFGSVNEVSTVQPLVSPACSTQLVACTVCISTSGIEYMQSDTATISVMFHSTV